MTAKVTITRPMVGICHMQVCAHKDATDEEILSAPTAEVIECTEGDSCEGPCEANDFQGHPCPAHSKSASAQPSHDASAVSPSHAPSGITDPENEDTMTNENGINPTPAPPAGAEQAVEEIRERNAAAHPDWFTTIPEAFEIDTAAQGFRDRRTLLRAFDSQAAELARVKERLESKHASLEECKEANGKLADMAAEAHQRAETAERELARRGTVQLDFAKGRDPHHVLRLISGSQISAGKGGEWLTAMQRGESPEMPPYEAPCLIPDEQAVAEPLPAMVLTDDFGDPETLFNSRDWLKRACEAKGARMTGGGIGCGQADIDIELEGCRFNVSIRPLNLNGSPITPKAGLREVLALQNGEVIPAPTPLPPQPAAEGQELTFPRNAGGLLQIHMLEAVAELADEIGHAGGAPLPACHAELERVGHILLAAEQIHNSTKTQE